MHHSPRLTSNTKFLTLRMSRILLSICSLRVYKKLKDGKKCFLLSIIILFCFICDEIFYHLDDTMVKMKVVENEMQK